MTSPIGDTYIPKSNGPRTEPWGTPDEHSNTADLSDPTAIYMLSALSDEWSKPVQGYVVYTENGESAIYQGGVVDGELIVESHKLS